MSPPLLPHDSATAADPLLTDGGALGALMRGHDWSASPLGPPEQWPPSLRSVVGLMLGSKLPMFVAWGPALGLLYNDAYAEILGDKHPRSLGARFRDVWGEIWTDIAPLVDAAMAGEALYRENLPLLVHRNGADEEAWFTFSYSPLRDETGQVAGMFCGVAETTATIRSERAVRDSEARLRLAIDGAKLGTWDWDLTTRRGTWSARTMEILGVEQGTDIDAEARTQTIHPDDRERVWRDYRDAVAAGDDLVSEYRAVRPDGEVRWIVSRGAVERDVAGTPIRAAGIVLDVTDEKTAEAALRESEARLRIMADAMPQIVWITDAEGRAEFFNRQWFAYTGDATPPATAATTAETHVHPDDAEATMRGFDAARASGTTFRIEHRIRARTGEYRWFLVRAEPYRDPRNGAIARWFGASVDIHDRKVAEARLRELNDTLEAQVAARVAERDRLWNLSQDMLARADYAGMMSAASPAWERVLGWSEAELLSRGYVNFLHPDDEATTLGAIARMAETGEPARVENRILTRDGDFKPVEWTVAPEPGGTHFIAVGRDISLTRAREAELALAQDALRQSQKIESMGQLTGGVAHDVNNLLTPIMGSLDLLRRRGVGSEREQRMIDGALQSAERAKTLVQRLLAFARRQPLQPVPVDIAALIGGMTDLIASTSGPRVQLDLAIAADLPAALADPNQLEMAVLNLAVNARDAMPEGGTLTLAADLEMVGAKRGALRPGVYVRLAVADTGVGMDEATASRAIEPFYSTKGVGKGTGLGLSMAHGLAAQLGGTLEIRSKPGQGTTVALWLPASDAAVADAVTPERMTALRATGTALVVDDEELVRASTADMLADLGYAVVEADSGEAALRLIENGLGFDLLVTDHLMAGITGTDLARAVRERQPGAPVLVISGYAEVEGIAPDLPRLTKPFRRDELAASLAQLLPAG